MDEKQLQKAMQLISIAGDSKSQSIQAMQLAEDGKTTEAQQMLKDAKKTLHEAHNIQTGWMTEEMNGAQIEKSLLLIHSQDHFMSADIMLTVAEKVINLHKELDQVKTEA